MREFTRKLTGNQENNANFKFNVENTRLCHQAFVGFGISARIFRRFSNDNLERFLHNEIKKLKFFFVYDYIFVLFKLA